MKHPKKKNRKSKAKTIGRVSDIRGPRWNDKSRRQLMEENKEMEKLLLLQKKVFEYWSEVLGYAPDVGLSLMLKRYKKMSDARSPMEKRHDDFKAALYALAYTSCWIPEGWPWWKRMIRPKDFKRFMQEFEAANKKACQLLFDFFPKRDKIYQVPNNVNMMYNPKPPEQVRPPVPPCKPPKPPKEE